MRRLVILLFVSLASIICNSCRLYSTIAVPVNETALKEYQSKKKWTIQSGNDPVRNIAVSDIGSDVVKFNIGEPLARPDHGIKSPYWAAFGRYKQKYFHLATAAPVPTNGSAELPLTDVTSAKTHELSIATVPLSILTAAAYGAAFVVIVCNCPYIEFLDAGQPALAGALFPGAMSATLERNDNVLLSAVPTGDGPVKLRISNRLPETEYIDKVSLYALSNFKYSRIGTTVDGKPVSFAVDQQPLMATTRYGMDILCSVATADTLHYDMDEIEKFDQLNTAYLTFERPKNENPLLVVKARQNAWMETVAEFFFSQFGDKFQKWTDRLDETDPQRFNKSMRDRGISMNAFIKVGSEWKYAGSFENFGSAADRTVGLPLDLTGHEGSQVEVKLESAYGFWRIDETRLADQWSDEVVSKELRTLSALHHHGEDVMEKLRSDDGQYAEQPQKDSFITLEFEPAPPGTVLMMGGNGFYRHVREYDTRANIKLIRRFDRDPITTHQLSRILKAHIDATVTTSATVR